MPMPRPAFGRDRVRHGKIGQENQTQGVMRVHTAALFARDEALANMPPAKSRPRPSRAHHRST